MTEEKLRRLIAEYERGGVGLDTLAAEARMRRPALRALLVANGVEIRKGGRPAHTAALQFGAGKAKADPKPGGPRLKWQQEQAERNARAVAEGRVRVYTPEERKALEAKMLGGGK